MKAEITYKTPATYFQVNSAKVCRMSGLKYGGLGTRSGVDHVKFITEAGAYKINNSLVYKQPFSMQLTSPLWAMLTLSSSRDLE